MLSHMHYWSLRSSSREGIDIISTITSQYLGSIMIIGKARNTILWKLSGILYSRRYNSSQTTSLSRILFPE